MSKFEDNGGYYIDGVRYMDCKVTGIPVKNVSEDATYVISDKHYKQKCINCFQRILRKRLNPTNQQVVLLVGIL